MGDTEQASEREYLEGLRREDKFPDADEAQALGSGMPDRIAIDAKGFGWRVWDHSDYWSMVPQNPDNSPVPEPLTWFVRQEPIPMRLTCPECGALHVDVGEFATKLHHTHACQRCGMVWRPAIVFTVGVEFLPGFRNDMELHGVKTADFDGSSEVGEHG